MKPWMKHFKFATCAIGVAVATLAGTAQAQQVPIPTTAAEVSGPVSGTLMTKEYVQTLGRTAYFWGYPIVATSSRRDAFAKAPERLYLGGVLPMAPIGDLTMLHDYISPEQSFIVCPNQDVVYGGGFAALDKEPMVFQVRTSANVSGSIPSMTTARMKLAGSASNTAPSPASTCIQSSQRIQPQLSVIGLVAPVMLVFRAVVYHC